jgi:hypothetical protein
MKPQKRNYQFYYRLSVYGEQINEYKIKCCYPKKTKVYKELYKKLDNLKIATFGYYPID